MSSTNKKQTHSFSELDTFYAACLGGVIRTVGPTLIPVYFLQYQKRCELLYIYFCRRSKVLISFIYYSTNTFLRLELFSSASRTPLQFCTRPTPYYRASKKGGAGGGTLRYISQYVVGRKKKHTHTHCRLVSRQLCRVWRCCLGHER